MTGEPEAVPPLARVVMPDVDQHGYRAYPLVDHVADKVAAMFELHGERGAPSTRYKDPDRALWERGYAAEAGRSLLPVAHTLDDALATVTPFLDPLLDGSAAGRWDPEHRRWTKHA